MELIHTVAWMKQVASDALRRDLPLGLVPTMGALHAGHLSLVREAQRQCSPVVVSIFVNPKQFLPSEDFQKYPRTLETDRAALEKLGVDYLFAPAAQEIYPQGFRTSVNVEGLSERLDGRSRPGHFRGVATVVLKLFEIVLPDLAYFGEKDAQQLAIIRRMVGELNVPVKVVAVETVREPDGLALSSRNQLLTAEQRRIAPVLSQALFSAREMVERGESSVEAILGSVVQTFARYSEIRLEYFEIVDPGTLALVPRVTGPVLIAGAIWLGSVRLIDNLTATPAAHLSP
jgi:pantoate--beta-alanine ligase